MVLSEFIICNVLLHFIKPHRFACFFNENRYDWYNHVLVRPGIFPFITLPCALGSFLYINRVLAPLLRKMRNLSIYVGTNNFILYMNLVLVTSLLKIKVFNIKI